MNQYSTRAISLAISIYLFTFFNAQAAEIFETRQQCANNQGYKVHLSFDDGPKIPETIKILDILKRHRIKATFLISMDRFKNMAKGNPPNASEKRLLAVIERMKAEGHTVGSHSFAHLDHSNPGKHSAQEVQDNLNKSFIVAKALNLEKPTPFRLPYGSGWLYTKNPMKQTYNHSLISQIKENGHQPFHWDLDTDDWSKTKRKALPGSLLSQVCDVGGGVALMHDIHPWTADHLEVIIRSLTKSGHEIVSYQDISRYTNKSSMLDSQRAPGTPRVNAFSVPREEAVSDAAKYLNLDSGGLY